MDWKVYSKDELNKTTNTAAFVEQLASEENIARAKLGLMPFPSYTPKNFPQPLGDFLCLDTDMSSIAYVSPDGLIGWIPTRKAVLCPAGTLHIESGPPPASQPLRSGS
jgi:hypothetical protein